LHLFPADSLVDPGKFHPMLDRFPVAQAFLLAKLDERLNTRTGHRTFSAVVGPTDFRRRIGSTSSRLLNPRASPALSIFSIEGSGAINGRAAWLDRPKVRTRFQTKVAHAATCWDSRIIATVGRRSAEHYEWPLARR
jgi:hypothetical protein